MDGYKVWCDTLQLAHVVEGRLLEHGYKWFNGVPSLFHRDELSIFFGDERKPYERQHISYADDEYFFHKDMAIEVGFNEMTDEFLDNVLHIDEGRCDGRIQDMV